LDRPKKPKRFNLPVRSIFVFSDVFWGPTVIYTEGKANIQTAMLNRKYQPIENQSAPPMETRKSGPIGLVVASMVGFLVWLVFILVFALYWSEAFNLFQNIVVFIVSLCITGLLIGLMWIIWGRDRIQMWS
jgi:hypothetical protein